MRAISDPVRRDKALRLLDVFGAPIGYVVAEPEGGDRKLMGAAERRGLPCVATELGGAGSLTVATARIAYQGTCRALAHFGVAQFVAPAPGPVRRLKVRGSDYYVYAPEDGVFEPLVDLGAEVAAGTSAARIHFPETPWREPVEAQFQHSGTVICRRTPGRSRRGDCLLISERISHCGPSEVCHSRATGHVIPITAACLRYSATPCV